MEGAKLLHATDLPPIAGWQRRQAVVNAWLYLTERLLHLYLPGHTAGTALESIHCVAQILRQDTLHAHSRMERRGSGLVELTGLARSTIRRKLAPLLDRGVIIECLDDEGHRVYAIDRARASSTPTCAENEAIFEGLRPHMAALTALVADELGGTVPEVAILDVAPILRRGQVIP